MIVLLNILCFCLSLQCFASIDRSATLMIDGDTGEVLYSHQADERRYIASLTKKMTLYILFEELKKGRISLDTTFTTSSNASRQIPSKLGLKPGQKINVRDAILALAIKSANDVAVVVAEGLSGSVSHFSERMNQEAIRLEMTSSRFYNPSGVPGEKNNVSTARDMITLAQALYRDFPQYWSYFRTKSFSFRGRSYHTHNHLLRHEGVDGIKTGWIHASGFNISTSAVRRNPQNGSNKRLFIVVMGKDTRHQRDAHALKLLNQGFRQVTHESLISKSPIPRQSLKRLRKEAVPLSKPSPLTARVLLSRPLPDGWYSPTSHEVKNHVHATR